MYNNWVDIPFAESINFTKSYELICVLIIYCYLLVIINFMHSHCRISPLKPMAYPK